MKTLLLSLLFIQSSFAALPPLWEGVKEIKAILENPQLGVSLQSGEEILKIKRIENGWLIITNKNRLPIKVVPQPQTIPGPQKFELEFGKVTPHE
jgi:hypothetical protein